MQLKYLKLAGFKSFVDSTVAHFPGRLIAVLGPNGCGKSNIIDAVRWVLGESSAKNLRGESMTDVIFNGSSNRKPLGQASVELVFDNSLGRIAGQFASYAEISVKRVVTRDGESFYYLNGSRCRRRDITEIFLGTGAGARGYSIIGQGTISKIIEAKPEELRVFLEEAADVSKYKERRRETLQRIEQTRDNLIRIADIKDELDKQLQRLERQAKAAERYTLLKEEERLCKAEILALKWQDFTQLQRVKQTDLQHLAIEYEQQQSLLTALDTQRIILNEQLHDATDSSQQIQSNLYQLGTEIARTEETVQQQARNKKRLEQDRQQMQEDWQLAQEQWIQDKTALENSEELALLIEAKLAQSVSDYNEKESLWQATQYLQQQAEERWQDLQNASNTVKRELQVAQLNLQHNEQKQQELILRLEKINQEISAISLIALEEKKQELQALRADLEAKQISDEQQGHQAQERVNQLRVQLKEAEQQVHQHQDAFHRLNSEHAALVASHKAALRSSAGSNETLEQWVEKPRLMDVLQVEPQWQLVCDRILQDSLQAYVLNDFEEALANWQDCVRVGAHLVSLKPLSRTKKPHPCLADKILGPIPSCQYDLETIYTANDVSEGLSWLNDLEEGASVITPDGIWFGKGWAKFVPSFAQDEPGILARQEKIASLALLVQSTQNTLETLRCERDQLHAQLQVEIEQVALLQSNLNASNEALRVNTSAFSSACQALDYAQKQTSNASIENETLQDQLEALKEAQLVCKEQLSILEGQHQEYQQQHEQCLSEKNQSTSKVSQLRQELEQQRNSKHQTELEFDREKTKIQQLKDRITREQERLSVLQERLELIAQQCLASDEPNTTLKAQLTLLLTQHAETESQLIISREQLSVLRIELEQQDSAKLKLDATLKELQETISQKRLQEQELAVRASALQESLAELGVEAQNMLDQLPEGVTQSLREDALISISQKIKNLGAINLAAIEEFAAELQRKHYLDEQYDDLNQALNTLEMAIDKMDEETRLRLQTTFDEVNTSFKALFPRLFGGGSAQLQLTCDNLLEAGIVVMAQPPGKRNSTIHLLSGGEKALTAVALVFAIFRLNPSPFCMLDEVDAPLDDVNVGRFCDLVKEMSQFVQFIFITHNKVTMELADHLIGVTMREPGVSRLVTVDVKQALTME